MPSTAVIKVQPIPATRVLRRAYSKLLAYAANALPEIYTHALASQVLVGKVPLVTKKVLLRRRICA